MEIVDTIIDTIINIFDRINCMLFSHDYVLSKREYILREKDTIYPYKQRKYHIYLFNTYVCQNCSKNVEIFCGHYIFTSYQWNFNMKNSLDLLGYKQIEEKEEEK